MFHRRTWLWSVTAVLPLLAVGAWLYAEQTRSAAPKSLARPAAAVSNSAPADHCADCPCPDCPDCPYCCGAGAAVKTVKAAGQRTTKPVVKASAAHCTGGACCDQCPMHGSARTTVSGKKAAKAITLLPLF